MTTRNLILALVALFLLLAGGVAVAAGGALPGNAPPVTPAADTPPQVLIDRAVADLSTTLPIAADQIKLVTAAPASWPNAGLGCPKIGVLYIQTVTTGWRLVFQAGPRQVEYHSGPKAEAAMVQCNADPALNRWLTQ